jgi:hypothetical protein
METRLTSLEARFDAVLPSLATHTDISILELKIAKVESTLVKWFAGVGLATCTRPNPSNANLQKLVPMSAHEST